MSQIAEKTLVIEAVKEGTGLVARERIINRFATVTQFVFWPFAYVFFNLFFSLRITGQKKFSDVRGPFIIVCNHISFYDSFLFRLVLGAWSRNLPLRFMAVDKFNW